jgi:uncharacterized SAM-binding protein YcdF (DUF218 family)
VRLDASGRVVQGALAARIEAAAAYAQGSWPATIVVASGGRRWGNHVEADVMARELTLRGVPEPLIVRERCSLSTRENARFTAAALGRRGIRSAAIVTSDWHLPRAVLLFRLAGMSAIGLPARPEPGVPLPTRVWRRGREGLLMWVQATSAP